MQVLSKIINFILHLDKYISTLIQDFGIWTYLFLFLIIFCETGLVVTPFLPGDSLLFAIGAFCAKGSLNIWWSFLILGVAAVLGDTINYWIGHILGPKVFNKEKSRFFKKEYLERTHQFYEKYGGETIIIARFVPIIRTFAPFVAGIGSMTYGKFLSYNIIGGVGWVAIFLFGGYFFGQLPFVEKNFTVIIVAIIFISILPGLIEILRHRRQAKKEQSQQAEN